MGRFRILSAVLVVLGLAAMLTMPAPAEAGRANDVKFWASEFRVQQTMPRNIEEGEIVIPTIELSIKGRASSFGGDKADFEFDVPDARMWLDVLQICSGSSARLSGVIAPDARISEDGNKITGKGGLAQLSCRQILK